MNSNIFIYSTLLESFLFIPITNYLPWIISTCINIFLTGVIPLHAHPQVIVQLCSSGSIHPWRSSCSYRTIDRLADRMIPIYPLKNFVCRVRIKQIAEFHTLMFSLTGETVLVTTHLAYKEVNEVLIYTPARTICRLTVETIVCLGLCHR